MEELDDNIAEVYRSTNREIILLLKDSQCKNQKNNSILAVICGILSVSVIVLSILNYCNNRHWLEVFNSYEYATTEYDQDGDGVNNISSGIMGDMINGAGVEDQNCNKEKENK